MNWSQDSVFASAVDRVLQNEGGDKIVNDSRDPGGLTKYGISQRSHPGLDIANLTQDQACQILFDKYWMPTAIHELPEPIGAKVLDMAVMSGAREAITCLQRAIRACGPFVKDDGVIGAITLATASTVNRTALGAALRSEAAAAVRLINQRKIDAGEEDPYLQGWLDRAYR